MHSHLSSFSLLDTVILSTWQINRQKTKLSLADHGCFEVMPQQHNGWFSLSPPTCVAHFGKKKKSQIGEAGETEESNQDSLALFHRFWVHSHFCFFPFLASFPVPDNLHIIPHQLLHLFPSSRYFLLSVA